MVTVNNRKSRVTMGRVTFEGVMKSEDGIPICAKCGARAPAKISSATPTASGGMFVFECSCGARLVAKVKGKRRAGQVLGAAAFYSHMEAAGAGAVSDEYVVTGEDGEWPGGQ